MNKVSFYIVLIAIAATLTYRVTSFPIYFFCDEAIHGVEAESLLRTGKDLDGTNLPLYTRGLGQYQLGASVYAQIPFNAVFGLNEKAVRFRSVFFSLLAMILAAAMLKRFSLSETWPLPIVFGVSSVWFLHSRAGFESLQASVLLLAVPVCLGRMLAGSHIFAALSAVCAALSFYSFAPARGWSALIVFAMLVFNARLLWRNKKAAVIFFVTLAIIIAPYVYFQVTSPDRALSRLQSVGLQEFLHLPFAGKGLRIWNNYVKAIDPRFWFTWSGTVNSGPQLRHVVPFLPPIPFWLLPLCLIGAYRTLQNWRTPEAQGLMLMFLLTPLSATPFEITNLRILPVGMSYLVLGALGLGIVLSAPALPQRWRLYLRMVTAAFLFSVTLAFNHYIHHTAPYKYRDYGYYGVQFGAPEIFNWIKSRQDTYDTFFLSNDLFNETGIFIRFYLKNIPAGKAAVANSADWCRKRLPPHSGAVWLVRTEFLSRVEASGCPLSIKEEQRFTAPTGQPLFSAVLIEQRNTFEIWLSEQTARQKALVWADLSTEYGPLRFGHSPFDTGQEKDLFDHDDGTLVRSVGGPVILELNFPERRISKVSLVFSNNRDLYVKAEVPGLWGESTLTETRASLGGDRGTAELVFPKEVKASKIRVTVHPTGEDDGYVYLRDLTIEGPASKSGANGR